MGKISTTDQVRVGSVAYSARQNAFGDTLPVIPSDTRVQFGSVLFRLDLDLLLTLDGKPDAGAKPRFEVSGVHSHAQILRPTDANGRTVLRLETRYPGKNTITPLSAAYQASAFEVNIGEAWYEAPFLITAYICCDEADFCGELVDGNGVGKHRKDFLFSGSGVVMEGTGRALDGRYITITNPEKMKWNPGYAGVSNPSQATFNYCNHIEGAFSDIEAGRSIAIDPTVLPPRHRVEIYGSRPIGERRGDDTGGAIKGYHFDQFVGAGKSAMQIWEMAGGNVRGAKVKYLGA